MQALIGGCKPTKQMRACVKLVEWGGYKLVFFVSKRGGNGEEM